MSRIALAPEVADDFDRILSHLAEHEVADAPSRLQDIISAGVVERNPLIGQADCAGNRELVIGWDARGYVALYRDAAAIDTVFVLAVRGQREAGYERPLAVKGWRAAMPFHEVGAGMRFGGCAATSLDRQLAAAKEKS